MSPLTIDVSEFVPPRTADVVDSVPPLEEAAADVEAEAFGGGPLECLVVEDMHFNSYVDHCHTRPFEKIMLYSRCLTCGPCPTAHHLPERAMRQFGYTQSIRRQHVVYVPPSLTHK